MTLIRFLAVGRSIGAVQTAPSRYRVNAQALLPKFGREDKMIRGQNDWEGEGKSTSDSTIQPALMSKHSIAGQLSQRSGGAKFWGPWTRLKHRFTPGAARAAGPPVQGELALDMVRPVRNDLSDTDFEIVTPSKRKNAPSAPPVMTAAPLQQSNAGAKLLWGRVRGRLFGARQA